MAPFHPLALLLAEISPTIERASMNRGITIVLITLALSTVFGVVFRFRSGHFRSTNRELRITSSDIQQNLGSKATFVQFSSAFCQPCRATKNLLSHIAINTPGIDHIEIDAESHLDLVRKFHITRTPTTLIVDKSGRILSKAVGLPRKQDVLNTINELSRA